MYNIQRYTPVSYTHLTDLRTKNAKPLDKIRHFLYHKRLVQRRSASAEGGACACLSWRLFAAFALKGVEPSMVRAIVGANWGDEGKGKITDMLASESDIVDVYKRQVLPVGFS